jgi:Peptidase family M28
MKALFIALLAGCAAVAQAPSTAQMVASRLTAGALMADVSFLASDALEGRGTPSRGLDLAAEYIAAQYRRGGLEPAGDDGYFQSANFATVAPNAAGLEFALEAAGSTISPDKAGLTIQEGAALDLHHAAVVKVAMDAAAVDALAPEQVRGKVLALLPAGNAANAITRRLPALAAKLQPALILIVRPTPQPAGNRNDRPREATEIQTATPILVVGDAAVLSGITANADATVSVHMAAPTVTPVKLRNVVGILRGSDPVLKDTYLLITAHYDHLGIREGGGTDHIFNGADDDASGTASVIEIAGAIQALPERPKRSIVFIALFGEELGDLGSRYYAAHPIFPLAKTIADVNLEQLGRTDDTQGPHVGMFNLTGFDYTDISTFLGKAGELTGVKAVKDEKNSDPYFTRSDNNAFAQAGVPSTTLSVAYDFPDYHKAGDEWQKLDYENLAKVDRAIALAAIDIANNPVAPQWNAKNPKVEPFMKAREKTLQDPAK